MVPDGIILYKCSSSDNSVLRCPSVRTVSYGQRSFAYSALLFGTLFLNMSALRILSLLLDPVLKFTFSVLLFNLSVVISVSRSFISCVVDELEMLSMFCDNY